MRFERKYQITHLSKSAVEQAIRLHPAGFRPIFAPRQVNNIYFDTPDFQTFRHNLDGTNQRKKYRLRWYSTDLQAIVQPNFEVKIKHNELGTKQVTSFPSTSLSELPKIIRQVNQHTHHLLHLTPTLLNTYQRGYWGTSNGKFRITVDWQLNYYAPHTRNRFCSVPIEQKAVVVELKYEEASDYLAKEVLNYLPFRQTKHSKYVNGILLGQTIK
ncbi:MAG: VTC domain-containing protein [Bacteroidota bacterium]